jgi:hypothetical protein
MFFLNKERAKYRLKEYQTGIIAVMLVLTSAILWLIFNGEYEKAMDTLYIVTGSFLYALSVAGMPLRDRDSQISDSKSQKAGP